jgi:hypothetical protein
MRAVPIHKVNAVICDKEKDKKPNEPRRRGERGVKDRRKPKTIFRQD